MTQVFAFKSCSKKKVNLDAGCPAGLVFLLVFWVLAGACQRHGVSGFIVQFIIISTSRSGDCKNATSGGGRKPKRPKKRKPKPESPSDRTILRHCLPADIPVVRRAHREACALGEEREHVRRVCHGAEVAGGELGREAVRREARVSLEPRRDTRDERVRRGGAVHVVPLADARRAKPTQQRVAAAAALTARWDGAARRLVEGHRLELAQ